MLFKKKINMDLDYTLNGLTMALFNTKLESCKGGRE
jgi:hypothetical protein